MADGIIEIRRTIGYARLRKYAIYLDGKKKAAIGYNKTIFFSVSPGHHSIYAKIDWVKSDEVKFEIQVNQALQFALASRKLPSRKYWLALIQFAVCLAVGATFGVLGAGIGGGIGGAILSQTIGKPYLQPDENNETENITPGSTATGNSA